MIKVAESDRSTSLNAMWTAYRRSRLERAENCPVCRTHLRMVALVLIYRLEIFHGESGEGVGAAATTTYGYDHNSQRVSMAVGSTTTHYSSKYFSITSTTNGATTTATSTAYIWAGDTLVAYVEQDLINGTATGTPRTFYVHPDHLGSTNVVTNASGTVVTTKDYYPYGSERIASGSGSLARGFIGQFEDGNNLSYLNARFYQNDRGQFLSQDPVFWEIGQSNVGKAALENPQMQNAYAYALGNPILHKDPDGRAVYLAAREVIANRQHLYYYISPEQNSRYSSVGNFTLGGGPQYPFLIGFGELDAKVGFGDSNNDSAAGLSGATSYVQLNPQEGQSEDAMISSLYRGHVAADKANADYWFLGNSAGKNNANSNSYARTLAQYAGILSQFNSFTSAINAPGSSRSVPLGNASNYGVGNTNPQGSFVGTYNFGPSVGVYNFGTQSWVDAPKSSK